MGSLRTIGSALGVATAAYQAANVSQGVVDKLSTHPIGAISLS
jgi:hypothetical protein